MTKKPVRPPHRVCISGQPNCGFNVKQTFVCDLCSERVCYCQGGDDEDPDSCAECVFPNDEIPSDAQEIQKNQS